MNLDQWTQIAKVADVLVKLVAFSVGGWWTWRVFVRNRLRYPKANISQAIEHRLLDSERRLVRLIVKLENCGDVLLKVSKRTAFLLQVFPVPQQIKGLLAANQDIVPSSGSEADWPQVGKLREIEPANIELEPKESDRVYYDFVIPASVSTIIAESFFQNASKKKEEIGWRLSEMYDLDLPKAKLEPRDGQQLPRVPPEATTRTSQGLNREGD